MAETMIKAKMILSPAAPETDATAGMVEAQNKTLTEFSREIANTIQSLQG